ncbi:hypothetical protein GGR51DRAFT_508189 [Nemania sp. FL0031]|nr:hypothetical protein GGR51DRAFT_508189 [Nemania sp. FL0031]
MVDDTIYGTALKKLPLDTEIDAEENVEWAYVDQLMCRFRNPRGATWSLSNQTQNGHSQERFQANVRKEYGALRPYLLREEDSSLSQLAWCVVSGQFWPKHTVVAAHIVGCNLGEASAH